MESVTWKEVWNQLLERIINAEYFADNAEGKLARYISYPWEVLLSGDVNKSE